jgi:hypothetical protein
MKNTTLIYALTMLLIGGGGYFLTGAASITALIPAFFALPMFVVWALYDRENLRKHLMHAALLLAMLGIGGSASAIPKAFVLLSGGEVERPAAVISRSLMAVASIGFLAAGIRSFIAARRK